MKVAIVGNGILGLMLARELAQRGQDEIVVLGPPARLGSASLAAAAMLNSFAELEHTSLGNEIERFKFDLSREATRRWPALLEAFAGQLNDGASGFGTYLVNNAAADELDDDNFDAIRGFLDAYAEPYQMVEPRSIPNYRPEARLRATRALLIEREGWVNPKRFISLLEAQLRALPNVHFLDQEVHSVVREGMSICGVKTEDGQILAAERVVLANGASLSALLQRSELDLPIQRVFYGVGVSIELRSSECVHQRCVRTPNRGLACGVYSVPYARDSMLVGASNFITPVPEHHGRAGSVYSLVKSAIEQINRDLMRAQLVNVNVGWRPTTSDTFPLLGPTSVAGLFVMGGTKRDGFHLSPVLAEAMAQMLHGEATDARYRWLLPERALIRSLSREEAVNKAVRHMVSAAYQHDFVPAKSRMLEQLRAAMRADVERVHDAAGAQDWGIPPELLDMYRYGHIH